VSNILLQLYSGMSNAAPDDCPYELLMGPGYIHEEMLGCQYVM